MSRRRTWAISWARIISSSPVVKPASAAAGSKIVGFANPTSMGTAIRSAIANAGAARNFHCRASRLSATTVGPATTGRARRRIRSALATPNANRSSIPATPTA